MKMSKNVMSQELSQPLTIMEMKETALTEEYMTSRIRKSREANSLLQTCRR
jgi:hypothetical protein